MGIYRTGWGSRACVICPSNGRANTKPSDLPRINPIGTALLIISFIPLSSARREAPLGVLPQEFRQTDRQHLILGLLGLRNRLLYFQEREFSGQRKAEVASPIECRFRRDGR